MKKVPPKGIKFDGDKARWDLLPMRAVASIVEVLTHGAKKYAPDNWKDVENPDDRYYAALLRHLTDWRLGKPLDESGLPHLAHAGACLIFLLSRQVGYDT